MSDLREIAEKRVDSKLRFYNDLKVFVVVNLCLAVINAVFTPEFWWVLFPIFFWGIGVLVNFLKAFVFVDNIDYREKKIEEEIEKLGK